MSVRHQNMGGRIHGSPATVDRLNGPVCLCNHRESPHHKAQCVIDYPSIYGKHQERVKLLSHVERSTRCRMKGCHCVRFTEKKEQEAAG